MLVLLIEDNPGDIMLVEHALAPMPVDVVLRVTADGEQALALLTGEDLKPDLILLDLNLPKSSGFEFMEQIRGLIDTPVLVYSGSQNEADRERALRLGAREYILKPMSFDGFVDELRGAVQRWYPRAEGTSAF